MENFTLEEHAAMFVSGIYSIDKLYDEYAKSVGLTYIGLMVLSAIYETDGIFTQKLLSEQVGLPKQSVNVVIRSLWEQGYVEMKELESDRRNKEIWLSETGEKYTERIIGKLTESVGEALGQLTYVQRQDVIDLINQVTRNFKNVIHAGSQNADTQEA